MAITAVFSTPEERFESLLRDARNGSREARWQVVQLFRRAMLAVANQRVDRDVAPREAASDIVQDTIIEAQRDLDGFRGETEGEMLAWLTKALARNIQNVCRKHKGVAKRSVRRQQTIDGTDGKPGIAEALHDPNPSPSVIIARREEAAALDRAIRDLPEPYRRVIQLRYRKELSYEQIAATIGKTEPAVRKIWSRALQMISASLRDSVA